MEQRLISVQEILEHSTLDSLWIVVQDNVYDISEFAEDHPGGLNILLQYAGHDATSAYLEVHSPSLIKSTLPQTSHIGVLDKSTVTETWGAWKPTTGSSLQQIKTSKPPLDSLISAHDFELAAQKSFSPKAWAFVSSAATDCNTREWNRSAYSQIILRPLVLRNVRAVDTSTSMLGHRMRSPIFCCPTSMGKIIHPGGEPEIGRACRNKGIPQIVSTSCSYPFSEVMDAHEEQGNGGASGGGVVAPVFFQLYVDKDRKKSERLLSQVKERGAKAIFLTVDAPVIGKREADERIKADESVKTPMAGMQAKNDKKGGSLGRIMGSFIDASLTWEAVSWIKRTVPGLPVVLKGVQTAADAVRAVEMGVDAILLSNHGGRSLDTAPATILLLLELQKCCPQVFDKLEVYVDGGIQRGTDIFKALCLGAKAVGLGRGFLYALNYGKEGVEHFVDILNDELETTMQMCGITSLDQVHPGFVHTGAVEHLIPDIGGHPYAQWRPKPRSML